MGANDRQHERQRSGIRNRAEILPGKTTDLRRAVRPGGEWSFFVAHRPALKKPKRCAIRSDAWKDGWMPWITLILSLVGLVLLIIGSDLLVRGASALAGACGISPLVIGLTVVAFGTSAPELAVSVKAAIDGQGDVAMGNVVGSNTMNVLLILGLSAAIAPLRVNRQLIVLDVPVMIAAGAVTYLMCRDGVLDGLDGFMLFVGLIAYTGWLIVRSRREGAAIMAASAPPNGVPGCEVPRNAGFLFFSGGLALVGLLMLLLGADWMVDGAVALAKTLNVDELVISLTIVAIGTSLPEIATSLMATWRGQRDIAVGNVVGSCVFNLLCILGLASMVNPLAIAPALLRQDIPIMCGVLAVCWPVFFFGRNINRAEGVIFVTAYAAYTTYLILAAGHSEALPAYEGYLVLAILPMLGLLLLACWVFKHVASQKRLPSA